MKTNKILMAVALPALLAACTAEEFDQVSVQEQTLANRALLNPNFAINVANVESRFAWENAVWKYEAGDQFGAAITDVATQWSVSDNSMFGNYIFAKNEAGNYVTDSQMGEGVYMLYSYDGFQTKMARSLVQFDLTNQVCDLDDPTAEINKYENQLMFTPLYKLQEKYSAEPMAPTFYSYYGVGAFKFKNNSGQDLKISQIILKHTEGNMVVKGRVSQAAFANAAQFVYNESKEDYVLSGVHAALENKDLTTAQKNAKIEEAEEAFEETIYKATAAVAAEPSKGEKESSFITLNTQNYLLEDGEERTAYMFVPAGYEGFKVEIMVVDEEGETWSVYANAAGEDNDGNNKTKGIKVTGMDKLQLQRHKGNMIFGKSSDGKTMKTLNIKEENLSENSGYYVDSKAAMLELLDANLGDIKVHNSGDWAIDAEIVEAIIDYTGANIEFSNPITIKSAKALTNNDEWELALSGVEFDDVTVIGTIKAEDGKTVLFEGTTVELDNITVNGDLTIQAGANVTIKDGSVSRAAAGTCHEIYNYGALTVEMDSRVSNNAISNYGALTIVGGEQYVDMYAGSIEFATGVEDEKNVPYDVNSSTLVARTADYNVTVTVAEDVTFKLDKNFTIAKDDDSTAKYTFVNNGTIDLNGKTLTVNGALTNNNEINNGSVTVAGTLTNNKTLEAATTVYAKATLNNNGEAKAVVSNKGLIVTGTDSKTTVNAGDGRINNTNKAQVSANSEQVVFYTVNNKAVEDLEGILFKRYAVNTLRVTGTLTMDRPFGEKATPEQLAVLKNLELAAGAEVKVDGDVHTMFEKVIVEGDAKIYGWSKAESSLTFDKNVEVILTQKRIKTADKTSSSKGYVLTIADVAVGGTCKVKTEGHVVGNGKITFKAGRKDNDAKTGYEFLKPELKISDAKLQDSKFGDDNVNIDGVVAGENTTIIATAAELKNAFINGGNVVLTESLTLSEALVNKSGKRVVVRAPEGVAVNLEGQGSVVDGFFYNQAELTSGNTTFVGVTFNVPESNNWVISARINNGATVKFENCKFTGVQTPVYLDCNGSGVVKFDGCKFDSGYLQVEFDDSKCEMGRDLIIENCDFGNMARVIDVLDYDKSLTTEALVAYMKANNNKFTGICEQK